MKNSFEPEKIGDLENIYYGPDKNGKNIDIGLVAQYEDSLRTQPISPMREEEIKRIFSSLGVVEKIKEGNSTVSDFVIKKNKILIEVTSLNHTPACNFSKDVIKNVEEALCHIAGKKDVGYENFRRVGVIFYDIWFAHFKNPSKQDYIDLFDECKIDCTVLICDNASYNGKDSRLLHPTRIFFNKDSKFDNEEKKIIEESLK